LLLIVAIVAAYLGSQTVSKWDAIWALIINLYSGIHSKKGTTVYSGFL
jgi:hypothetical protein